MKAIDRVIKNALTGVEVINDVVKSENFTNLVEKISLCKGRVVISGVGKSGHIGNKISATLSSLGVPSIFVHPTEASHGDMGMLIQSDILIAISKSGESIELKDIILYAQSHNIDIVGITMFPDSFLGRESTIPIILPNIPDDCNGISAPTTSTTMTLVLGDCIAAAVAEKNNFNKEKYKIFHPGGKLGRSMTKIKYIMRKDSAIPKVGENANMIDAILEINSKLLGMTTVVDKSNHLIGVITDGDVRRLLSKDVIDMHISVKEVMNSHPRTIDENSFIDDIANYMIENKITSIIITDSDKNVTGVANIHDILR